MRKFASRKITVCKIIFSIFRFYKLRLKIGSCQSNPKKYLRGFSVKIRQNKNYAFLSLFFGLRLSEPHLRHVFARFAFLALHFIQTCTSRSLASASGNFAILYTPELTFSSIYNDVYDINIFGTAVSKSVTDGDTARKIP